ncbi:D-glycero-D-manno-heptose 1,7-bisphosphate phosphatase [Enhydrobacter aerosaccus]|uniref:D,D-heptose 1,7-bisphosphate phosphatase n=2 Tax=Enhydrobacter aerosaccus TaxID=225324 RepID=A0A1T4RWR9_9HYPH|nr:D-glycero-D-manno-heptose 1,7-bisphosphate phosphatase [Enhydrobacter aerosaccus]
MLDRDGVVIVNRKYNVKAPTELALLPGAAAAIARLNRLGIKVVLCTNQPEVDKGIITHHQLDAIHHALRRMLSREGAHLDLVLCCTDNFRSEWRKPAPGMLFEGLRHFGAKAADTPFVGDQLSDLKAAWRARCPGILVRTGLGRQTESGPIPRYARPQAVYDDLQAFVDAYCANRRAADRSRADASRRAARRPVRAGG